MLLLTVIGTWLFIGSLISGVVIATFRVKKPLDLQKILANMEHAPGAPALLIMLMIVLWPVVLCFSIVEFVANITVRVLS